jgi:hypothetical protein
MELLEFIISDEDFMDGIHAISLVDIPATGKNWIMLSEHKKVELKTVDEEKRIIMGVALTANKPIYRNQDGKEFNMFFAPKTVRRASELYLQKGNQSNTTLDHETNIDGVSIVESWIVEDKAKDKSALYKLGADVDDWVVSMKVENEEIWNNFVKTGEVKGFSIEAFFTQLSEQIKPLSDDEAIEQIKQIIN